MRADAARNLEAVLRASARMLGSDPGVRISDIAAEAGVDRRTVYRRFQSKEELLQAIYRARLDALERVIDAARLDQAPLLVALHSFAEGGIRVSRDWPVDIRAVVEPDVVRRREALNQRVVAFLQRAEREGVLETGMPPAWPLALLQAALRTAAHELPDVPPGPAADLVVDAFLHGIGARRSAS